MVFFAPEIPTAVSSNSSDLCEFLSPPQPYGFRWTLLLAIQARDTLFSYVVVHAESVRLRHGFHWAYLVADTAIHAFGVTFGEDRGESVEDGQTRAKRANDLTEEAPMAHGKNNDAGEYTQANR